MVSCFIVFPGFSYFKQLRFAAYSSQVTRYGVYIYKAATPPQSRQCSLLNFVNRSIQQSTILRGDIMYVKSEIDKIGSRIAGRATMSSSITLDEQEKRFFDLLLDMIKESSLNVTLRVAGGWVRDKLLGLVCHDIDIALDSMMGKDFAIMFNDYLSKHNFPVHHVGIIQTNPEQSKHLETAAVHILDFFVDFVNLRAESYEENSRIPSLMRFGTPKEDADRRDITINSLFYNIHTSQIEDHTGKGLHDMRNGIVRTPLHPLSTFHDDPLRVLRVVRFANRFGFSIEEETKEAIKNTSVLHALRKKISRERIGTEVDKMVSGPDPLGALESIVDLHLFDAIFMYPENISEFSNSDHQNINPTDSTLQPTSTIKIQLDFDHNDKRRKSTLGSFSNEAIALCQAYYLLDLEETSKSASFSKESRRTAFLACVLTPIRSYSFLNDKGKTVDLFKYILHHALKLPNRDVSLCEDIFRGLDYFSNAFELLHVPSGNELNVKWVESTRMPKELNELRFMLGTAIKLVGNSHWRICARISASKILLSRLNNARNTEEEKKIHDDVSRTLSLLYLIIDHFDIGDAFQWKPVLNGSDVAKLFHLDKGPLIGQYLEMVFEWQIMNPKGDPESCKEWLKAKAIR